MLLQLFMSMGEAAGITPTLSGTSVSPNLYEDVGVNTTAISRFELRSDGEFWNERLVLSDAQIGTEWADGGTPSEGTFWARATLDAGDAPNGASTGLGTWENITTASPVVGWSFQQTSEGVRDGTIKIEISSDSSGTPIVATGYYRGTATYTVI